MIPCFPALYDDELFASGCSRYTDRVHYSSHKEVVAEVFATTNATVIFDLPSHLGAFVRALPPKHPCTVDGIIYKHTLWPLFEPFLPVERAQAIICDMIGDRGPSIHMRAGIMASGIPMPAYLQTCDACVAADREKEAEAYWHRSHQLPGVFYCQEHLRPLMSSSVPTQNRKTRHRFLSAEKVLGMEADRHRPPLPILVTRHRSKLVRITLDAFWLMEQRGLGGELQGIQDKYKQLLIDRGFANCNGRVRMAELQEEFVAFYPDDLLTLLGCGLEESTGENWLHRIVRKPTEAQHPLRHLLMMQFLGCTSEAFFTTVKGEQPFGEGPWPCLNRAARHYLQPVVTRCKVSYNRDAKSPMGTFSCECGFIYTRNGPDTVPGDRFVLGTVRQFGSEWEQALVRLWSDPSLRLAAKARALGVDPITVKRYAVKLVGPATSEIANTNTPTNKTPIAAPPNCSREDDTHIEARDKNRALWLRGMKDNPGIGTKALRQQNERVYAWLYRHDREWLRANSPKRKSDGNQRRERVDWPERDVALAHGILEAGKRLRSYPGRPQHISAASIGREVSAAALLRHHLDKLPLASEMLNKVIETREDYAVRRIAWAASDFREQYKVPSRWDMIERAGVRRLLDRPHIVAHIEEALRSLEADYDGVHSSQGDSYQHAG